MPVRLGGVPPFAALAYLRPFGALFTAQGKNLPRQQRRRLKRQVKRAETVV